MEPPKNLITKILEAAVMFAVSCFLVKTAVAWIWRVRIQLAVIAVIIALSAALCRLWKHYRQTRWRDGDDERF